jgi:KaiC/GvpD/RAD55 family RecA-like ATPase
MKREEMEEKGYLKFEKMMIEFNKRPKTNYLWSGIKENSFGLVFGPSKSGKTIFCENFAMKIAMGAKEYFGHELSGEPKKILFMGLEEHWENRAERNVKQYSALSDVEKTLININYMYQAIDFQQMILSGQDWVDMENAIIASEAKVVFIDSITRMTSGKIENADIAGDIMRKLRAICYENEITLIAIHHTPKMGDEAITIDKIKGSAIFAQESDFAIGINKTSKGNRYVKNVFFRYAADDYDLVKEFVIDDDIWLDNVAEVEEEEILNRADRRRVANHDDVIVNYFNSNSTKSYSTSEVVEYFQTVLPIKERSIKGCLSKLSKADKINGSVHGEYSSVNYKFIKEGGRDEK